MSRRGCAARRAAGRIPRPRNPETSLGVVSLSDLRLHRYPRTGVARYRARDTGTTKSLAMEENLDVTIGQRSVKSYLKFFVLWNLHDYQGSPPPLSLNGV